MNYFLDSTKLPQWSEIHNVLGISGGGAMGSAELYVLDAIEKDAQNKFGVKKLYEKFDLIAGTSVGAINAAMLATGKYTVAEVQTFYYSIMKKIFTKSSSFFKPFPVYNREVFRKEWVRLFGNIKFGEVKTKLMITTYNRVTDETEFWKSWQPEYADEPIEEVIMRSFAAVVFFGQYVDEKRHAVYCDGGEGFFNSPFLTIKNEAEAFGWYAGNNHVLLHLVGCFYDATEGNFAEFKEEKRERTFKQLLDFYHNGGLARTSSMSDQINAVDYLAKKNNNLNYKYYDYPMAPESLGMDKIDEKTQALYRIAGMHMASAPMKEVIHY